MTVSAKVLADSVNFVTRSRLTTFLLTYPRFIHAELMTHRVFARNASSSRAIPSKRMRKLIRQNPAMPAEWGRNQAGMQAGAPISKWRQAVAKFAWLAAMHVCLLASALLDKLGVHKQVVNRIVEPWSHITVVLTGTDEGFANWYALRDHKMAEPVMQLLAAAMKEAHKASTPVALLPGEWHLPFVTDNVDEASRVYTELGVIPPEAKMSAARAARTSYLNHEGKNPTLDEDLALYKRLVGEAPVHASPTEHQAQAGDSVLYAGCFGPRTRWAQHRKFIPKENVTNLEEQFNV